MSKEAKWIFCLMALGACWIAIGWILHRIRQRTKKQRRSE
jgi:hypothetical protein